MASVTHKVFLTKAFDHRTFTREESLYVDCSNSTLKRRWTKWKVTPR